MQLLHLTHEQFSDSDAEAIRSRHRRGEVVRIHRGTYLDVEGTSLDALTAETKHAARVFGAMNLSSRATVSGISAAVLHGLPMLGHHLSGPVTVNRRSHGADRPHVKVRRAALHPDDVTYMCGVPVTTLRRTIQDLPETLEPHELFAAAEAAIRLGANLEGIDEQLRNRRVLRFVTENAADRSESFAESWSKFLFIRHDIPLGLQQVSVFDERGEFVARCDFGSEIGLLGEFDGRIKYGIIPGSAEAAAEAIMAEKRRENRLKELGWIVVRWTWDDLLHPERLLWRLEEQLKIAESVPKPRGFIRLEPSKRMRSPDWNAVFNN